MSLIFPTGKGFAGIFSGERRIRTYLSQSKIPFIIAESEMTGRTLADQGENSQNRWKDDTVSSTDFTLTASKMYYESVK